MGSSASRSALDSTSAYASQCAASLCVVARHGWRLTNETCANSLCAPLWPAKWVQQAEEADVVYVPIGNARYADDESFLYPSPSSLHPYRSSRSGPPQPYISTPADRALYAIGSDDEEHDEDIEGEGAEVTAASRVPYPVAYPPRTASVPHYSFRAHELHTAHEPALHCPPAARSEHTSVLPPHDRVCLEDLEGYGEEQGEGQGPSALGDEDRDSDVVSDTATGSDSDSECDEIVIVDGPEGMRKQQSGQQQQPSDPLQQQAHTQQPGSVPPQLRTTTKHPLQPRSGQQQHKQTKGRTAR